MCACWGCCLALSRWKRACRKKRCSQSDSREGLAANTKAFALEAGRPDDGEEDGEYGTRKPDTSHARSESSRVNTSGETVQRCYEHVPAYRKKLDEAGIAQATSAPSPI